MTDVTPAPSSSVPRIPSEEKRAAVLEKLDERVRASRPAVHLVPPGPHADFSARFVRALCARRVPGLDPARTGCGFILVLDGSADGEATLSVDAAVAATGSLRLNDHPLVGSSMTWKIERGDLHPGLNILQIDGLSSSGTGATVTGLASPSPARSQTELAALPPALDAELAVILKRTRFTDFQHLDAIVGIRRLVTREGELPRLVDALLRSLHRASLARMPAKKLVDDMQMVQDALGGIGRAGTVAEPPEELLAEGAILAQRLLDRHPGNLEAWAHLARLLNLAGFRIEGHLAWMASCLAAPGDARPWGEMYNLVTDTAARLPVSRTEVLEALEACRLSYEIEARPHMVGDIGRLEELYRSLGTAR